MKIRLAHRTSGSQKPRNPAGDAHPSKIQTTSSKVSKIRICGPKILCGPGNEWLGTAAEKWVAEDETRGRREVCGPAGSTTGEEGGQ